MITMDKLPQVSGALTQLKQLFTNLIGNAIKFRKPGKSPAIQITSTIASGEELKQYHLPANRKYHRIAVSDNGIGFDPEYAERIFQAFQRLHGKSEYPGSGVGLAICKKIMDQHNGAIYAEGQRGAGASFILIFPEYQA